MRRSHTFVALAVFGEPAYAPSYKAGERGETWRREEGGLRSLGESDRAAAKGPMEPKYSLMPADKPSKPSGPSPPWWGKGAACLWLSSLARVNLDVPTWI